MLRHLTKSKNALKRCAKRDRNVVGGTLLSIKYKEINENGEIFIEQEATRPTVYLDNWVIDLFLFKHKELGDSFYQS